MVSQGCFSLHSSNYKKFWTIFLYLRAIFLFFINYWHPIFLLGFWSMVLHFQSVLYILAILPFICNTCTNIFPWFDSCFLMMSVVVFNHSNLQKKLYKLFIASVFLVIESFPHYCYREIHSFFFFFFRTCVVGFSFKFRPLIHLKFILGYDMRYRSDCIFFQMATQPPLLKVYLGHNDLRCHLYFILNFHPSSLLFLGFLFSPTALWSMVYS